MLNVEHMKKKLENKGTVEIKTDRLILRKVKLKDHKDMYNNFLSKESSYTYIGGKPIKNQISAFFICMINIIKHKKITNYYWVIEYDCQVIGTISVNYIDRDTHNCNIGYTIGEKFSNKGIATEAVKAIIKFLFLEVKVHKISARHFDANIASGKVMEKAGMHKEAVFKDEYFRHGRYYDSIMYSIFQ